MGCQKSKGTKSSKSDRAFIYNNIEKYKKLPPITEAGQRPDKEESINRTRSTRGTRSLHTKYKKCVHEVQEVQAGIGSIFYVRGKGADHEKGRIDHTRGTGAERAPSDDENRAHVHAETYQRLRDTHSGTL